jgi:hypothetical protein
VGAWANACVLAYDDEPALDGHDQGTFTTGWEPYIRTRGDARALGFMRHLRDKCHDHFSRRGLWHHGYWAEQDVHHGTEHFETFLATLWQLDGDDGVTVYQVVDAAEHLGNWARHVPAWFDWDTGLFRALRFGTRRVHSLADPFNVPDHFRCVNLALLAHWMTGESHFLDLARAHATRWADAIISGEGLPLALDAQGGVHCLSGENEEMYRRFAGQAPSLADDVNRAENFLASGAVEALLGLWHETREEPYLLAARRLLDVIATQLGDADAGAAADAVRSYWRTTEDSRYDGHVRQAAAGLDPFAFSVLSIDPAPERAGRPSGIGKRSDMANWYEDGDPRRHNPILLAAAAEVAGDERLAARAVDIGRAYLALARQCYPHGRDHGCSARSVSAIARGHGRDNHAGAVTAVLDPVLTTFGVSGNI